MNAATLLVTGFALGIVFTAACLSVMPVWLAVATGIAVSIVCKESLI